VATSGHAERQRDCRAGRRLPGRHRYFFIGTIALPSRFVP
jgi:hypothetical protein